MPGLRMLMDDACHVISGVGHFLPGPQKADPGIVRRQASPGARHLPQSSECGHRFLVSQEGFIQPCVVCVPYMW